MMALTPEKKVKNQVVKLLKKHHAYYFFPATYGMGRSGVPDVVCCFNGSFIGVECKAGNNKPTELQKRELTAIQEAEKELRQYEVIISIEDEHGTQIPPLEYLQAAEHYSRMYLIDRWTLEQLIKWMSTHKDEVAKIDRFMLKLSGYSMIIILVMSAVGGSMIPRFLMPEIMQDLGYFTFNTWSLMGYQKVFWYALPGDSLGTMLASLWDIALVLLCSALVCLGVARQLARRWEAT